MSGSTVASGHIFFPGYYVSSLEVHPFAGGVKGRWQYDVFSMGPAPASGGSQGVNFFGRGAVSQYQ